MSKKETQERIEQGLKCLRDLRDHWHEVAEPITVLVADDNADFCKLVSAHISSILDRRCFVLQAFSGRETLDIIGKVKVDILFLDLRMPGGHGNGIDVLETLSKKDHGMIVLIITGIQNDSDEIKQARQLGYSTIIRKTELWDDLRTIFGMSCSTCPR